MTRGVRGDASGSPGATARAVLLLLVSALGCATACLETRRSLGEDCLKDSDCLSVVCLQFRCATSAPITDAQIIAEVNAQTDAPGGDAVEDPEVSPGDAPADGGASGD